MGNTGGRWWISEKSSCLLCQFSCIWS